MKTLEVKICLLNGLKILRFNPEDLIRNPDEIRRINHYFSNLKDRYLDPNFIRKIQRKYDIELKVIK